MKKFIPSYIKLLEQGGFLPRLQRAREILSNCSSCPHNCGVNRYKGELGKCYSSHLPIVSAYTPHFGEEPVISGTKGAGNIFFGNCNLQCVFCQNHEISQNRARESSNTVSYEQLAGIMLQLQDLGCHNIGLVSPTHFAVPILECIYLASQKGLSIPIVYNTNAYDSVEVLQLFDGIVDIYLPDFKYGENTPGVELSKAESYFENASAAITEMYKQTGTDLIIEDGILQRGLIIRHLLLPNGFSETEEVFRFIAEKLSQDIHISLMSQYFPAHKALKNILLNRTIRNSEYEKEVGLLHKYNLMNGWIQEADSEANYRPHFDFSRTDPFLNDT